MPSFDTDVPALLLRLDPNPYHHGTLGAARSLGRAGIEVHAVLAPSVGPVGRCRFLHTVHEPPRAVYSGDGRPLAPAVSANGPAAHSGSDSAFAYGADFDADAAHSGATPLTDTEIERTLLRAADAIGRPAVLFPLDDLGAVATARLAPRLAGRYLLPELSSPGLPARLADKAELAAVCEQIGVPHPRTVLPDSAREAAREAAALGLPAVAKWTRPWLLPPGLPSTALVRRPSDAARLFARAADAGSRLLLQRRLPGGHGTDWFFHGYAAEGGRFLVGGAGRKERSWPPRTGLTAVGTWLPNPPVQEAAARLATALDYRGIVDLDFRLDTATGVYHLVDFNPRPGAQFRLFTDEDGLDVVRAQHLHLTGRTVPAPRGGPGRVFVAENYALLSSLLSPANTRPGGTRAAQGPVERAWFAADDPLPFASMTAGWLGRCLRKATLRARLALPGAAARTSAADPREQPLRPGPDERSDRHDQYERHEQHDQYEQHGPEGQREVAEASRRTAAGGPAQPPAQATAPPDGPHRSPVPAGSAGPSSTQREEDACTTS